MNIYLEAFSIFFKIGAFTIGGGYAMVPLIENEIVTKRNWIAKEDFIDLLAISQSAPGILAVNISIFIGYRLRGIRGSIITALGTILPSFLIILAIALFFHNFKDNTIVERIFKGIRPAVVEIVRENFDLRPAGIIKMLDLRRPIYRGTAAYGHFGRTDLNLPWEATDKAEALKKYL